jgi:dynein intermediate chain 1, axonemal
MKRGKAKMTKRATIARTRMYEDSKNEELKMQDDDMMNDALQGLQKLDDYPRPNEKELEDMIERVLTVYNPQNFQNYTYYSHKERQFRREEQNDNMVIHLSIDGSLLLKDSTEANQQEEDIETKKKEADDLLKNSSGGDEWPTKLDHATLLKTLRNQFNYAERISQTMTHPIKEIGISTEPPPTWSFSGTVTQWDIYDNYMADIIAKKKHEKEEKAKEQKKPKKKTGKKSSNGWEDVLYSDELCYALKIMERMVNQNDLQQYYSTFKYVDVYSDQIRGNDGSLNELWNFGSEKSKKKEVTAMSWNPKYHDLFAVGYGSYSFLKPMAGLICCYSLKNTRYPEYFFTTQSGVMSLDWHPQHPALLAVGCYDGTVLVFDVRAKHKKPIYQSTVRTNKHTDPVWQVKWQDEDPLKNLSFFSISSDGRVTNWVLMKNKLEPEEIIKLKLVTGQKDGEEDETALSGLAGGTCFDFNPFYPHLFLVGTEEGKIHKCNKSYSGQYLETYIGHFMSVYSVKWNRFNPKIFISCSADWTVKLWDHMSKTPLNTFDLGVAVGDVAWAPYSSTIFCAVTAESKCYIYDISTEKSAEICDKKIPHGKLNHICFNPSLPIIIIGTDKGSVRSYKLSPNLRKTEKLTEEEAAAGETVFKKEVKKLENIINSIDRTSY